jgi:hypothetical protein
MLPIMVSQLADQLQQDPGFWAQGCKNFAVDAALSLVRLRRDRLDAITGMVTALQMATEDREHG